MSPRFWKGRKVFVTGHTGFKGAWLSFWLERLGAKVSGYSLAPPTRPSLFAALKPALKGDYATGDVRRFARLRGEVARRRPEIVFHLAAQSLVRESYRDPLRTYSTNVLGTAHVLEASRLVGSVRAVVAVTSDKCYEESRAGSPRREGDALGGRDPYSASKACAEILVNAHRGLCGGMGVATARAGNVIGGGDWAVDRLVPDCVRSFQNKKSVRIRYPQAVRPWQHVLAPVSGYLLLAERLHGDPGRHSEAWNFGPDKSAFKNVRWIVERLTRLWDGPAQWEARPSEGMPEAPVLTLDSAKARARLGWRPSWGIDQAVENTVEWYRAYFRSEDMVRHSRAELERFESGIA